MAFTQDYTKNAQNYKLAQSFLNQAMQPIQGANAATALGKILTAYFASKGMNSAQLGMDEAAQGKEDLRNIELGRAMGAYRGDKPFHAERFDESDTLPQGLMNRGTGQNRQALIDSLMGAKTEKLQDLGLAQMMAQPKDGTSQQQNYQQAVKQGYPGTFMEFMKDTKGGVTVNTGDYKMPANHMANPDFDSNKPPSKDNSPVMPIPGSLAAKNYEKLTGDQTKSSTFATRMVRAEKNFDRLMGEGYDPSNLKDALSNNAGTVGNFFKSQKGRQYYQAAADWVRAKLRKESGAVIGPQEMLDEISTYFAIPGDDEVTIEQKRIARLIATNGMINESQGAYKGDLYDIPEVTSDTNDDEYQLLLQEFGIK